MLIVPTLPVPSQTMQVNLANQICNIDLYQKDSGLFIDLYFQGQDAPVVAGVICENLNRIVRDAYLGFTGDFVFIDSQGTSDPTFDGLGTRFSLAYLSADDLTEIGLAG